MLDLVFSFFVFQRCFSADTMEALIAKNYTSDLDDLVLNKSVPYPVLPGPGYIIIKVHSTSINPIDWKIIEGGMPLTFPKIMGCDAAGEVVATCDNCISQVGQHVWTDLGAVVNDSMLGQTEELGAYAQFAVALDSQVSMMPTNLNWTEAAVLPLVALTSWKALEWYGGAPFISPTTVLILGGSGGTGTSGIQLAKYFGAVNIIVTASAQNSNLLKSLGAKQVIDYHTQDWWTVLNPGSVNVIYDTVGEQGSADRAMTILDKNGYFVTIAGDLSENCRADVTQSKFINSATNADSREYLQKLTSIVESGGLKPVIQQIFTFDKIIDAMKLSKAGHVVGKLGVTIPHSQQQTKHLYPP